MLFSSPPACFEYFESTGPRRGREPIPHLVYSGVRNWGRKVDVLENIWERILGEEILDIIITIEIGRVRYDQIIKTTGCRAYERRWIREVGAGQYSTMKTHLGTC